MSTVRTIKIFFASAIDGMEYERQNLNTLSNEIGNLLQQDNIFAQFVKWENFMKLEDYQRDPQGSQELIDQNLKDCELSLFLFKTRVGVVTKHEFEVARFLQKEKENHKIFVCCLNTLEDEQEGGLKAFQQQLVDSGIDWDECRDLSEVKRIVSYRVLHHLGIPLPTTQEAESAEKQGEELFKQFKAGVVEKERFGQQLHNVIDELLAQIPIIMDAPTDSVAAKIVKALELYYKADNWAAKTNYDEEKYCLLLTNYAQFLYDYGLYNEALQVYNRQVYLVETLFGINHPSTTNSYCNIGLVYWNINDYSKAKDYYYKALVIIERNVGTDNLATAPFYNNLGAVYKSESNYHEALFYYQKALNIIDNKTIADSLSVEAATLKNNIGAIYDDMGDFDLAKDYYFMALDIREKRLGKNHVETAVSYNNIGELYYKIKSYNNALKYFRIASNIIEKEYGHYHPKTATCYHNMGSVLFYLKNYEKGLENLNKALSIRQELLGQLHPDTISTQELITATQEAMKE